MSVYGKGYFLKESAEEKVFDEKAFMESMLLEAANNGDYSILEANYTFLPQIKKTPALRAYESVAREAEELLQSQGVQDEAYGTKIVRCIARFFDVLWNTVGTVSMVGFLFIPGVGLLAIPLYLVLRLEIWAVRWAQEALAIKECDKTITQYNKLLKETKNQKEKDKINGYISRIKDAKAKLQESSKNPKAKLKED